MGDSPNFVLSLPGLPKDGEKIFHPDFHLELVPMWHPQHDEVEQMVAETDSPYILAYYGSQDAVNHYLAQSLPAFGGLCYPHAGPDRIYCTERLMSVTALMDDTTTNPTAVADEAWRAVLRQHYLDALNGIQPPDEFPIAQLLYESMIPVKEQLASKPRVWERLYDSIVELIDVQTDSLALKMDHLTVERYLELRRVDNYGEWAATMTEYAIDVDMTDELAADESLREMRTAAIDSFTLVNDPYSFRKEIYISESVNSVWLLMHLEGLTLQQALNRLARMVHDNERKLIAAGARVLDGPLGQREDVRRYVTELEHLASGNAEFHAVSTRYHGREHKGGRFISGEVVIRPLPSTDQVAAAEITKRQEQ
ncbi:methyltransferase type 12 [Streptomyces griseocarneus]|nr:methyltransferase type 12 [Streptomyces griseocarneus]